MADTDVLSPLDSARRTILLLQARAAETRVVLRNPPPEPTTCCGRGCNGCVWEGYYAAMVFWQEDALDAIADSSSEIHRQRIAK